MSAGCGDLADAVARRVMGWHLAPVAWAGANPVEVWHTADGEPTWARAAWRPDEDEAQCAAVLERMVERGYAARIDVDVTGTSVSFAAALSDGPSPRDPDRRRALLTAALATTEKDSESLDLPRQI